MILKKRKKRKKDDFGVEDSLKFAGSAVALAIGTQVLKGVGK